MGKSIVNLLTALEGAFAAQGNKVDLSSYASLLEAEFASPLGQDLIVRKEVALGVIREIERPEDHIGLSLFPFLEVPTDDVIFSYLPGLTTGLAPARAEDAEAELAQKDTAFAGTGRASVVDWAIKDRYSASDVTRYREAERIRDMLTANQSLPLTVDNLLEDWANKVARDTTLRRRKLDNRIEWLIMNGIGAGVITYDDGKIKWSVNFQRPADQAVDLAAAAGPTFGSNDPNSEARQFVLGTYWDRSDADPLADIQNLQQYMQDKYGVRITRALTSMRVLRSIMNSEKFAQRAGFVGVGTGDAVVTGDPRYLVDGWGWQAAVAIVERATGLTFIPYDSVYRTRPVGSTVVTSTRFTQVDRVIFLPDEGDVAQFNETEIGFGRVLTSPHPEGDWAPGFYAWEDEERDPWQTVMGSGVKAFPVFPSLEYTATLDVLTPP